MPNKSLERTWLPDARTRTSALTLCFCRKVVDDQIVGTYILKPNQPGLGSHVANAGYMVGIDGRGKGVGRVMCEHSLEEARRMGFHAMQFNMVVSTNESAVALWKKFGFSIVGTLPQAYRHRELGLVDAYVMHRFL